MKRVLNFFLILFALTVIGYFTANYALTKISHKYVAELRSKLEARGLFFEALAYKDITILSLRSISINEVDVTFKLDKEIYGRRSFHSSFQAEAVIVNLVSIRESEVTFSLIEFSLHVAPAEPSERNTFGDLEQANFSSRIPINIRNPEASAQDVLLQVENLFQQNKAVGLTLSGLVKITLGEEQVKLRVETIEQKDSVHLQFDHTDIIQAAKTFDIDLADKEAEVIANHPNLVPDIIHITKEARQKSRDYRNKDNSFPEDAFRHIYWSYHLTRTLGIAMAKQITDAHETAPGNTAKERAMDYHNNEVARNLAIANLSEARLKNLVLTSEDIIRSPEEVME